MKATPRKSTLAPGQQICHQIAKKSHLHEGTSTTKGVWVDASLLVDKGKGSGKRHKVSQEISVMDAAQLQLSLVRKR